MTRAAFHEWWSAAEIADAGLPALPSSKRGVQILADRNGWRGVKGRARRSKGGGWEYHWSLFPLAAQAAIAARVEIDAAPSPGFDLLPEADRTEARRRLAIVSEVRALWTGAHLGRSDAVRVVAQRAGVEERCIYRWLDLVAGAEDFEMLERLAPAAAMPAPRLEEALPERLEQLPRSPADLKGWQRDTLTARLTILNRIDAAETCGEAGALERIAAEAKRGALEPDLRQAVARAGARGGSVSARTLKRWRELRRKGGDMALAPLPPAPKAAPPWAAAFLRHYALPSKPSAAWAYERMREEAPDGLRLPTLRTVERWVSSLGAVARNRGRMGPRELKTLRAHVVRDVADLEPTDVYIADGHTLDMEVEHPFTGRPFRPEATAVLDVKTRRCVGWSFDLAEASWAVADALRMAFETGGVPAIFYSDNGPGYVSKHLTGEAVGVLERAGVTVKRAIAYNSQARGVIERFNRTGWVRPVRAMPGFVGADMDREARQAVYKLSRAATEGNGGSPLMSWPQTLDWARETIAAYNARPHSFLPKIRDPQTGRKRHMSPDEMWAQHVADGFRPDVLDPATAEDLFRPYEIRKVRRGTVKIGNGVYFHRELELGDWHQRDVMVGYDIRDASRVWVRDMEQRLICIAELDANKVAYMPLPAIEKARERRAQGRARRIEVKRDEIEAERRGPAIEYQPEETFAAPMSDAVRARLARVASADGAVPAGPAPEVFELPREASEKLRVWRGIDARRAAGAPLSEREEKFWRGWQTSPEFRGQLKMEEMVKRGALARPAKRDPA